MMTPVTDGQGAVLGIIRAAMSVYGIRGPFVDFMFTGIRLANDQTLENYTGAGALPWTWPVAEQVIDILNKGVYAFATGFVSGSVASSWHCVVGRKLISRLASMNIVQANVQVCDWWLQ